MVKSIMQIILKIPTKRSEHQVSSNSRLLHLEDKKVLGGLLIKDLCSRWMVRIQIRTLMIKVNLTSNPQNLILTNGLKWLPNKKNKRVSQRVQVGKTHLKNHSSREVQERLVELVSKHPTQRHLLEKPMIEPKKNTVKIWMKVELIANWMNQCKH